jgi:lauroyl/myristoyl acyltransferase
MTAGAGTGLRTRLGGSAYAAGWRLVRALPEPVAGVAFRAGADLASRRGGRGIDQLRCNLRRIVGPDLPASELDDLVRAGVRSYARYWREAFRLPSTPRERVVDTFRLENPELIDELLAGGRGLVAALSHSGNWDHAGAWAAYTGKPVSTVAERLKPETLYDRFVAYRASIGIEVVPLTGGSVSPMSAMGERLRDGGFVCLVADRDFSERGLEVDFFGGRTKMPAGPALLALRTGAPLIVCQLWYVEAGTRGRLVQLDLPSEGRLRDRVQVLTQRMADAFAEGIAAHPQDWHMLQPVWLDGPRSPGRRS